jgi:hypothetical protein
MSLSLVSCAEGGSSEECAVLRAFDRAQRDAVMRECALQGATFSTIWPVILFSVMPPVGIPR